jgi:LysR family nod box-dependent transcriptional activator
MVSVTSKEKCKSMRYKGLDLNLLVALDRLLAEKSVSKAAKSLHLTQSATSGALSRLREHFNDELLIRLGRSMVLTPRAIELQGAVRNSLMQIDGTILKRPDFDPATAQRDISIVASDYMTIALLSDALAKIGRVAPGLHFSIQLPGADPRGQIERGEVDFLVMPDVYSSANHPSISLMREGYRAVVWEHNTIVRDDITLQMLLDLPHVAVRFPNAGPTYEGWVIERYSKDLSVEVEVGSFSAVPFLLVDTNRVALMHERLAKIFAKMLPLRLLPCPVDIPPIQEIVQWNLYNSNDACMIWVRDQLVNAAGVLDL